ncbi:MAG: amidohydrolase family protein [Victivallales bacterium]|nr:amidohydrolase family protein [Victivallales bacterium]
MDEKEMIFDGHIHLQPGAFPSPAQFWERARSAGVFGGCLFSLAPYRYRPLPDAKDWRQRLDVILDFASQIQGFYPFFWIDPTSSDVQLQVETACEMGIRGFKVICSDFYPEEGEKCYRMIAEAKMPLVFHCGGLWSEGISNKYNRPTNFEFLAAIPELRVALAHFGWPWCDELIALYGKFVYLKRQGASTASLFLDTTPGTPAPYRKDVLHKVLYCCADAVDNCYFGSDACINNYSCKALQLLKDLDKPILDSIADDFDNADFPKEMSVFNFEDTSNLYDRFFRKNYRRFVLGE